MPIHNRNDTTTKTKRPSAKGRNEEKNKKNGFNLLKWILELMSKLNVLYK